MPSVWNMKKNICTMLFCFVSKTNKTYIALNKLFQKIKEVNITVKKKKQVGNKIATSAAIIFSDNF